MIRVLFALPALAIIAAMSGEARAATVYRDYLSHGSANCHSALPVEDGHIIKRPRSIANEGTVPAFITCDFDSIDNGGKGSASEASS